MLTVRRIRVYPPQRIRPRQPPAGEATSSLDPVSELHIKLALRELKGNCTQIIIAHRLSTIEDADRIIVIDGGKKVGDGTREQLLERCPTFQRLWMPQDTIEL